MINTCMVVPVIPYVVLPLVLSNDLNGYLLCVQAYNTIVITVDFFTQAIKVL